MAEKPHQPPTTDALRKAIDTGRTGDKVSWSDPAAAPLGTDDEAAGETPGAKERKMEQGSIRHAPDRRVSLGSVLTYVGIALVLLVIFGFIALLS